MKEALRSRFAIMVRQQDEDDNADKICREGNWHD